MTLNGIGIIAGGAAPRGSFQRGLGSLLLVAIMTLGAGGCGSGPARAPVADRTTQEAGRQPAKPVPAPPPARPDTYTVKKGDTLYSIALDHGVDHKELARWNGIQEPGRILVGQELRLSAPVNPAVATAAEGGDVIQVRPLDAGDASVTGGLKTAPKALKLPYSEENLALLQRREVAPAAPETPAQPQPEPAPKPEPEAKAPPSAPPADAGDGRPIEWSWPARGKLLAGFNGSSNKGIDIGGKLGDPVLAAAPGRVMYTGTGIRGYGKLIIIRHDSGFTSVYANNRQILVKQDQVISRGQKIAELGDTDSDRPKLHFEIRIHGVPQDPVKFLPDRS